MTDQTKIKTNEQYQEQLPLELSPEKAALAKKALEQSKIDQEENNNKKKKKWKFSFKSRSEMKKGNADSMITVFLITSKRKLKVVTTKLYPGNFFVIDLRVYEFDPGCVLFYEKNIIAIYRDYDRKPVSVNDFQKMLYEDLNSEGHRGERFNANDPPIIKAILAAHLSEKMKAAFNSKWLWIIGAIVLGVVVAIFYFGGKK